MSLGQDSEGRDVSTRGGREQAEGAPHLLPSGADTIYGGGTKEELLLSDPYSVKGLIPWPAPSPGFVQSVTPSTRLTGS